jgi:hypothetical protein
MAIFKSLQDSGFETFLLDWSPKANGLFHKNYPKGRLYGRGLFNLSALVKFEFWVFQRLREIKPSVLVAIDSETFPAALSYKVFMKLKGINIFLILDLADPLPQKVNNPLLAYVAKVIENLFMRAANRTVFPSPSRIPKANKGDFLVVENVFISQAHSQELRMIPKIKGRVFYGGLLLKDRGLHQLVQLIKENKNLDALVCGYGEMESYIVKCSQEEPRIQFIGSADFTQISRFRAASQFSWCWYDQTNVNNVRHASGKLIESFQVGSRPITNLPSSGWSNSIQDLTSEAIQIQDHNFALKIQDFLRLDQGLKYPRHILDTQTAYKSVFESQDV